MKRYYIAYGSNLSESQMAMRCPTAKVVGTSTLKDWRLLFDGPASIERFDGYEVPVLIWDIQPDDERSLDRYEGYPTLYRKEYIDIEVNGKVEKAMVYIMNKGEPAYPSRHYYDVILQGYYDVGLKPAYLDDALKDTYNRMIKNEKV